MPLPITLSARLHIQLCHLKGFFLENKGVSSFENVPFVYSFAPSHFSVYVKELVKKYAWLMSDLKIKNALFSGPSNIYNYVHDMVV
jgi:hypothetical protein